MPYLPRKLEQNNSLSQNGYEIIFGLFELWTAILLWDLLNGFFYRTPYTHPIILLHGVLAQQFPKRTSQGDCAHDFLRGPSQRELAETTWYEHHIFSTRVALVLPLACSHWWFSVLSTIPFKNPNSIICILLGALPWWISTVTQRAWFYRGNVKLGFINPSRLINHHCPNFFWNLVPTRLINTLAYLRSINHQCWNPSFYPQVSNGFLMVPLWYIFWVETAWTPEPITVDHWKFEKNIPQMIDF